MSQYSRSSLTRRSSTLVATLIAAGACALLPACSRSAPEPNTPTATAASEQRLVERSAAVFDSLRKDPRYASMDGYLERARGVMIFPRLVKASLLVGGEGGNGVLIARRDDGGWSAPAFYSIGAPSVGLQIGYQEATVVLFIMKDSTLERAFDTSFVLGAKAGATLGDVEDNGSTSSTVVTSANIYQVIAAEGAFAGVSLDGYIVGSRPRRNRDYYGKEVTPRDILVGNAVEKSGAAVLERALAPRPEVEKLEASTL